LKQDSSSLKVVVQFLKSSLLLAIDDILGHKAKTFGFGLELTA